MIITFSNKKLFIDHYVRNPDRYFIEINQLNKDYSILD